MEFRQLSYFLAAAQTQNFRKASELCLVAQSALSRQIAALEAELGVALFERVNRRVYLTAEGREFAGYARAILDQLQASQQAVTELKQGERGLVTMGCVEALIINFVPQTFSRFHQQFPHIKLKVKVGGALELMRSVEEGALDFGVILGPTDVSDLLVVRVLFRQPLQLVVAPTHPLAQEPGRSFILAELANEPMVMLREGFSVRRVLEQIFAQRGIPMQPIIEIDSVEGLKEFVKQGIGITFMPLALIRPSQVGTELAVFPVSDIGEELPFAVVYRRFGQISKAATKLREFLEISSKHLSTLGSRD